ncbi:MAG: peptidoglycan-binding protein [Actinomycetota bacterium]
MSTAEGRRPKKRVIVIAVAFIVVVGSSAAIALRGTDDSTAEAQPAAAAPTTTTTVKKQDLIITESVTGQLGFADQRTLSAFKAGVVTRAAQETETISNGKMLFAINAEPTVLLTGKWAPYPAYRPLKTDVSGPDVEQLEEALVALGYGDDLSVDEDFTSATADAVQEWEDALGRENPDGVVELGDVVFASGSFRVADQSTAPGSQVQAGGPVLVVTSTAKLITADWDASRVDDVAVGDKVELDLPDGTSTTGKISEIGTVESGAQTDATAGGAGSTEETEDPTVPIEIQLADSSKAKKVTSGDVDIAVETSRQKDALTVPVTALVALSEGGYAVEVNDGGATNLVAVKVGTISDDVAAITGEGIKDGTTVVVPK